MKFVDRCCNWREKGAENYSILFAGDICPRATGLDAIMEGKVAEVFKEVKPVFDAADLRVVQWETTITESETPIDKTGPNLKVPYKCAEIISHLKADVALLANNHIGEFTGLDLPERWTYYCVSQWDQVPNQFAHLPSARNRIMGVLSYVYNLDGFLHWGYNFWFSQLSVFELDPYSETCAGGGFPPGDAFKVYPGKDGIPEDSIRHEVFYESGCF